MTEETPICPCYHVMVAEGLKPPASHVLPTAAAEKKGINTLDFIQKFQGSLIIRKMFGSRLQYP